MPIYHNDNHYQKKGDHESSDIAITGKRGYGGGAADGRRSAESGLRGVLLADSYASVCAISYDVRPNDEADAGLSVVRRVSRPVGRGVGVGDVEIFDLLDCCLSCSVKHDAGGTLASLRVRPVCSW